MGKTPDIEKPKKAPAPVTPESSEVQAVGQRTVDELRSKKGRGATFFTNPASQTGFSGMFGKTTGGV